MSYVRPLNPSGLSPPRPPRVRRWRRVTFQIERPHDSGFITYLKISSLESGFRKLRIRRPDLPDTCGRKPDPQRKSCGFKNIRIHVDGGLISKIVVSSSDCRDFAHGDFHIPLAWLSVQSYSECHDLLDRCAFPRAIIPKIWTKDFFFKVVLMHQLFLATTVGTWRIWRCFWSPWSIAQSVVGLWGVGTLKRTAGRRLRSTATVMTRDPLWLSFKSAV